MPRTTEPQFGSDSFLDVVTNVVGILIILVMVVGLRIKQAPVVASSHSPDSTPVRRAIDEMSTETARLAAELDRLQQRRRHSQQHHDRLTAAVASALQGLAQDRQSAEVQGKQIQQIDQSIRLAQADIARLEELLSAAEATTRSVKIESFPTPISRAVEGKEGHFLLQGGRVAFIPLDRLLERLKADAPGQFWKLRDLPEATGTAGPIGGFRLRYTFQRVDMPLEDQLSGRRAVGSYAQLSSWTLVPSSSQLGETVEEALAEKSEFRAAVARLDPRQITITLWVYPDSFAAFRQLKKELYLLGFATAGRPLPEGQPIAGSPRGSKSAAQ